jgi:hypothetical protein
MNQSTPLITYSYHILDEVILFLEKKERKKKVKNSDREVYFFAKGRSINYSSNF